MTNGSNEMIMPTLMVLIILMLVEAEMAMEMADIARTVLIVEAVMLWVASQVVIVHTMVIADTVKKK